MYEVLFDPVSQSHFNFWRPSASFGSLRDDGGDHSGGWKTGIVLLSLFGWREVVDVGQKS